MRARRTLTTFLAMSFIHVKALTLCVCCLFVRIRACWIFHHHPVHNVTCAACRAQWNAKVTETSMSSEERKYTRTFLIKSQLRTPLRASRDVLLICTCRFLLIMQIALFVRFQWFKFKLSFAMKFYSIDFIISWDFIELLPRRKISQPNGKMTGIKIMDIGN